MMGHYSSGIACYGYNGLLMVQLYPDIFCKPLTQVARLEGKVEAVEIMAKSTAFVVTRPE